jgi:hypothetical protein
VERTRVGDHKGLVTSWIAFWPIDGIVLMFNEPFKRMYLWLANTYERITENAMKSSGLSEQGPINEEQEK